MGASSLALLCSERGWGEDVNMLGTRVDMSFVPVIRRRRLLHTSAVSVS